MRDAGSQLADGFQLLCLNQLGLRASKLGQRLAELLVLRVDLRGALGHHFFERDILLEHPKCRMPLGRARFDALDQHTNGLFLGAQFALQRVDAQRQFGQ